jgi:hypothetical protein
MTAVDLVVRGGTLANGERADVAIADGRIVAIGPAAAAAPRELDATGKLVLPSVIDAHVHFNEPGRGHWEGFAGGTRALAAGGATCAFEMPLNANSPTLDAGTFAAKAAALAGVAHVDLALWGGLTPDNLDRLDELAEAGVIGLKAFMSRSGTPEFAAADDATLYLWRCTPRMMASPPRWRSAPVTPAGAMPARIWTRARRSPSWRRSGGPFTWRPMPGAGCTSCTSARAGAWRWSARRAPPASM